MQVFQEKLRAIDSGLTRFERLQTLQVNLGDRCNLSCIHCHHSASPTGTRIMGREVIDQVVRYLERHPGLTLDITGGCPELNPHFRHLVEATAGLAARRIIRSNLSIALEKGMEWLPDFYREQNLVVMASLPCYELENVEAQRGRGVYQASIEALTRLNQKGYGKDRELHLVYNPGGTAVAAARETLEQAYRQELRERFGISFNHLHCMNNVPLGRYRVSLEQTGAYQRYLAHLAERFNPDAAPGIMCRTLISIGWDGTLYNCDFNLAAGLPLRGIDGAPLRVAELAEAVRSGNPIRMAEHCFSCTAGHGSGCGGSASVRKETPTRKGSLACPPQ
ncbi:arsenosugar biosynthesis radical SAM (seleno)protein ArsS [Geomesophilobacter sediminis]|uniref:Arsenosugar biosynthesis radical SAM protein ArsS n=1 Tax=Geomesophilobacter sediminis TaxID=2798584 RepID=A0A8J7IP06_9BACT|nr:arsenosugar biosynthesis radical SAM (seleno)protein ArsS [Geomesophilobacter sediminis]MBJ6725148.1 arsenosugar biosynthesis radical SAM protein ArsS [Geomesophilobacter sediminis]